MSILRTTNTGLYEHIFNWCEKNFPSSRRTVSYRIGTTSNGQYVIYLSAAIEKGLIILHGKDIPCKVYFENKPTVIFNDFNDKSITKLSQRFNFFCDSVRFSNCLFTEKSIEFICKFKNIISNSYIIVHNDRELARALLNNEPYNKLFVENNVKVIYSEEEEEEEEVDEVTYKDKFIKMVNTAINQINLYILKNN